MQATNDSTIEVSTKSVRAVSGKFNASDSRTLRQTGVRDFGPLDACGCCQIKAKPEFNDRAYNERVVDVIALPGARFPRKIKAPLWIGLPEINTGTKPIVVVVARTKGLSRKYSFSNLTVAAVIAKNECRSETVQELSVVFGDAARFGVDTLRHESLQRNCGRFCYLRCKGSGRFFKMLKRRRTADVFNPSRAILVTIFGLHRF